jgi:glyoxylate reductase
MSKPKVFVTRIIPEQGLDLLRQEADIEVWDDKLPPAYETLLAKVKTNEGLLSLLTDKIDANLIDQAGKPLKVISQMAVGFDNIDIAAATERGIPVGHTPGVLTDTTADFAFTLLMAAARRIVEGEYFVKKGLWITWDPTLLMGQDIHNATLGLIGFGRIGQGMASRASGFNMRTLCHDPWADMNAVRDLKVELGTMEEVLTEADFVSIHVPLLPETHHLISTDQLSIMKSTSILINTARGSVVDHDALYQALKNGDIAYAALDVTEPEPIHTDDPLLTLDNCLIMPHIASSSVDTRTKMATMAAENMMAGLMGRKLPYCANPEVYS